MNSPTYYELTFKMDALAREFAERVKDLPVSEYDDEITTALDTFHDVLIRELGKQASRRIEDELQPGWMQRQAHNSSLELAFVPRRHRSPTHKLLAEKR